MNAVADTNCSTSMPDIDGDLTVQDTTIAQQMDTGFLDCNNCNDVPDETDQGSASDSPGDAMRAFWNTDATAPSDYTWTSWDTENCDVQGQILGCLYEVDLTLQGQQQPTPTATATPSQTHYQNCPGSSSNFYQQTLANRLVLGRGPEGGPGDNCHVNVSVDNAAGGYLMNDHIMFNGQFSVTPPVPDSTTAATIETGKVQATLLGVRILTSAEQDQLWGKGDPSNTGYLAYKLDAALQTLQSMY